MADDSPVLLGYARRHVRFGWGSLLFFLTLGFVLELLHGFKAGMYLDVSNETLRLMWTLAHAHGALLGLVHVLFALSLRGRSGSRLRQPAVDFFQPHRSKRLAPRRFLSGRCGLLQR